MSRDKWSAAFQGDCLWIEGDVTLDTVSAILARVEELSRDVPLKCLDLSSLGLCDSSAVALVIELQRRGITRVLNAPKPFLAIAHACQLDAIFPDFAQNRTESGKIEQTAPP